MKVSEAVKKETLYILCFVVLLSVLMQAVFLVMGKWDLTVLYGNILSGGVSVLNFFLMGLTVQRAVEKEEKQARITIRNSQSLRMIMLFAVAMLGAALPQFNTYAVLIPFLFPRFAIFVRPLFDKKKDKDSGGVLDE